MSTHRTEILEHMNDLFNNINPDELRSTPTIIATFAMRDGFVKGGFPRREAGVLVSKMKIELPNDLFDDEDDKRLIFEIIDNMVKMVVGLFEVTESELGSFDLFASMIDGAELVIKDS